MQKYKSLSLIHQARDRLLAQWRPNINFIILMCAVRSGETRSVKRNKIKMWGKCFVIKETNELLW